MHVVPLSRISARRASPSRSRSCCTCCGATSRRRCRSPPCGCCAARRSSDAAPAAARSAAARGPRRGAAAARGAFARPYVAGAAAAPAPCASSRIDRRSAWARPGAFRAGAGAGARRRSTTAAIGERVAVIAFDDRADGRRAPGQPRRGARRARRACGRVRRDAVRGRSFSRPRSLPAAQPAGSSIVTDLQRAGWEARKRRRPFAAGIDARRARRCRRAASNLAVASLRRPATASSLTVRNGGGDAASGTARISVDRQRGRVLAVQLHRRARRSTCRFVTGPPAAASLTAAVDDPAGFPADNTRLLLLDPSQPRRVLSIVGRRRSRIRPLCRARAAVGRRATSGFEVEEQPAAFLARGSNQQPASDAAVVLLSTRGLDRESRDTIAAFVRNGGGLLVAASSDVEPAVLATMMGWQRLQRGSARPSRPVSAGADRRAPSDLPAVRGAGGESRRQGASTGRGPCGPTGGTCWRGSRMGRRRSSSGAEGRGRVVLFASDLDRRWNDFPLNPAFVPFAIETVRYAAGIERSAARLCRGRGAGGRVR